MTTRKHYIEFNHSTITRFDILKDTFIIHQHGSTITITDPAEVVTLIQWAREAKRIARNRDEVCRYLEYMLDHGQYEC